MNEWISCEEKMPTKTDWWVIVYAGGPMNCMGWSGTEWQRCACKEDDPLFNILPDDITHWMPLPDAPVIDNQEDDDEEDEIE